MLRGFSLLKIAFVCLTAALTPLPASSATFSFSFGFPGSSDIPELPDLTKLAGTTAAITVSEPTTIDVYKLRQTDPVSLSIGPTELINPRLVLGSGIFDVSPQSYSAAGTFLGSVNFSGSFFNSLGITATDPVNMTDVPNYYAFLPFTFYIGPDVPYSGIGPFIGTSDILYFTSIDGGLYRLQAAPEPSTWVMMLTGFAVLAFAGYRSRPRYIDADALNGTRRSGA